MTEIKNFLVVTAWLLPIMLLPISCSSDLDVKQAYTFDLETMPVPKKIIQNGTVEIRCQIVKEGEYKDNRFTIRFFQTDGKGELRLDDGSVFEPNDLYPLKKETFRLYYTSHCTDQQVIDVYIQNSFGQVIQKTFSFQNENVNDESDSISEDSLLL